jgi:hypothetical protein
MSGISKIFQLGDVTIPGTHPKLVNFLMVSPPVTNGLIAAYLLGGDDYSSARNHVDSDLQLGVIGKPEINETFGATLDYYNCFDTQQFATPNKTWFVVAKPLKAGSSHGAGLISQGRYVSSVFTGDQFGFEPTNLIVDRSKQTSAAADISNLDETKWAVFACTRDSVNKKGDVLYRQSGVVKWLWEPKTYTVDRDIYTGLSLRIGGHGMNEGAPYPDDVEIGVVIMYDRSLSHAECELVAEYLSSMMSSYFNINDV